jgi:hypothetical protein
MLRSFEISRAALFTTTPQLFTLHGHHGKTAEK